MKRFFLLFLSFFAVCTAINAASPNKKVVTIKEMINKSTADEEFFRTFESRLQDAIVNTGKFLVVDNERKDSIASEVAIQEDGLSSKELDIDFELAEISIHGTILAMTVTSKNIYENNLKTYKTTGNLEANFQIYYMTTREVKRSKKVNLVETGYTQDSATIKDTSKLRKHKRLVEPEKVVENSKGEVVVVPAKYEEIYFTPTEEKVYNSLMQAAVDEVVELLMETEFPLSVMSASSGKVYINLPEERAATIAATEGTSFEILQRGDDLIDPDTGEVLGSEEELVMVVEIDSVRPKYVIGTPTTDKWADNMPLLEKEMKAYNEARENAKTDLEKSKIKSPFEVRVIKDKKKKKKPEEDNGPSIDDFFDR